MKKSKGNRRVFLIGLLSFVLLSFQNCAIYQNEGREFLDSRSDFNGIFEAPPTAQDCLPYMSNSLIQATLGLSIPVESSIVESNEINGLRSTCSIILQNTPAGEDAPTCVMSSSYNDILLNFDPGAPPPSGAAYVGPNSPSYMDGGGTARSYLEYASDNDTADPSNDLYYNYYGLDPNVSRSVVCYFSVSPTNFSNTNTQNALASRGRALVDGFLNALDNLEN